MKPLVSVCIITYQHRKYIEQCIEGVVGQKTDFPFEIIIGDDGSSDGTTQICQEYQRKYPALIQLIVHDRSLNREKYTGCPGAYNFIQTLSQARGKYIAVCEGDDYWLDNTKLQQQVDFLEWNSDFTVCFHSVFVDNGKELEKENLVVVPKSETTLLDLASGNYIHTPSVVYRNIFPNQFPDIFYTAPVVDYLLHLYAAERGKVKHIDKKMAVYRIHVNSYWSSKGELEKLTLWNDVLKLLKAYFVNNPDVLLKLTDQIKHCERLLIQHSSDTINSIDCSEVNSSQHVNFQESKLAHSYLDGLVGIEVGASAQNPFGLDAKNVDYTMEMDDFKQEQIDRCGEYSKVDIVLLGDDLPLEDNEVDFVISSHAIEHFFDPIKVINEWLRVAKKYVFIIVPHKERTFDKERKLTTPEELKLRNSGELTPELLNDPKNNYFNGSIKPYGHWSVWNTETFVALCHQEGWNIVDFNDVDDKVGNGFTVVLSKDRVIQRSLNPNPSNPYYILAPNYTDSSSGVRALHMLCHSLNLSGKESYVTSDFFDLKALDVELPSESTGDRVLVNDNLRTPILSSNIINQHKKAKRKPIIIYPETVEDNPLNADLVVRYLLNKPSYLGGRDSYDEAEMLFTYSDDFLPEEMDAKTLYVPTSDLTIFNPHGSAERSGTYFYADRYLQQGGALLDVTKGATQLSLDKKRSLTELAEIFKTAELLYSYERTALCREAMLCGCPVVYLPNNLLTSIPSSYLFGNAGVAWGATDQQIEHAKNTVKKIYPTYIELEKLFWQQLDVFMVDTQLMAMLREPEFKGTYSFVDKSLSTKKGNFGAPLLKIAILSADLKDHACLSIRLENVLNRLERQCEYRYILKHYVEDGEPEIFVDEDTVEWADIVIIQRTAAQQDNVDILNKIFSSNCLVVYETDDLLTEELPTTNILYSSFKRHIPYIREVVKKANLITVSTPYLERHLLELNSNISVLPNLVDDRIWDVIKPEKRVNKLKILYAGTITHIADLESIENALILLYEKYHDKIEFIFAGCVTDRLKSISSLALKKSVPYEEYATIVQNIGAHISIAPLIDDPFNNSKSNIKWLEYSMCGCAGVYSNIEAYNTIIQDGETGLLVDNEHEWFLAIERLILNDEERYKIASSAQKLVLNNYTLSRGCYSYVKVWQDLALTRDHLLRDKLQLPVNYEQSYQFWNDRHQLTPAQVEVLAERVMNEEIQNPTFHLIIVLNENELPLLSDTLDSLQEQLYSLWGLTIISDSPPPEIFNDAPENMEWVCVADSLNNTINKIVKETNLDWIMQLFPGDKLLPYSLLQFFDVISQNSKLRFIYSDEVSNGATGALLFKPDFNLELLRSTSYLGRSVVIRRDTFEEIGGYTGLAYVYATDLAFNVFEQWGREAIAHVEDVLYICSMVDDDQTLLSENELAVRVAHFERQNLAARVLLSQKKNIFHIKYPDLTHPLVSIIIANKNNASPLWLCVDELLLQTDYDNYEVIIVDQMSELEDMPFIYQEIKEKLGARFTLLTYPEENYSAMINFAATHVKGEYIVVMANSMIPVNRWWLTEMCLIAQRIDVGVVGAKVIDEEHKIIHGGGVLGVSDDVSGVFSGEAFDEMGYMDRLQLSQEYSFVSSACFMVSANDYHAVNGMDEGDLTNTKYCVADLCLRIKQLNRINIWTPQAVVRQDIMHAMKTNGVVEQYDPTGETIMINRWPMFCQKDPAYNRNLSLRPSGFDVETDINIGWGEQHNQRPRIMAFPFNHYAIGQYRVIEPLLSLEFNAKVEVTFLPEHDDCEDRFIPNRFEIQRSQADVLFMHLTLNDEHIEFLQWIKAETTLFVIFSIDDLITSLPSKNSSKKKLYKDIRYRLRKVITLSDRVIVSTQKLADEMCSYCEGQDVVVVPNCIDLRRWGQIQAKPNNGGKIRVGWAGGEYHLGDLDLIINVIKETVDKIDWIFMGLCPEELKPYIYEYHDLVLFEDYPEKLANLQLDLAVAPLELHPFNEAKSNLKLLEYGILGLPVICSNITPYQTNNPPVVRVNNTHSEWMAALDVAISHPNTLKEDGKKLREWVLENYNLEQQSDSWFDAITKPTQQ